MDNLSLLQGIFPTQGSNAGLTHCRQILYQLSHNRRWLLDVEKHREMDSSLGPPGGTNPADSLTLAQWDWFQSSDCTMMRINSCFFKPPLPSKEKTVRTVSSQGVPWIYWGSHIHGFMIFIILVLTILALNTLRITITADRTSATVLTELWSSARFLDKCFICII